MKLQVQGGRTRICAAIKYKVELTPSQRSDLIEVSRNPGQAVGPHDLKQSALALLKADEGLSDRDRRLRRFR